MENDLIITGSIEEIRYINEENGYQILVLDVDGQPVVASGTFPPVSEGESLKLTGEFVMHPRFGRQFKSEKAERIAPNTTLSIFRFLSSGIIKGLGPKTAEAIIAKHGKKTLEIMEKQPHLLGKIRGVSAAKAQGFCEEYKKHISAQGAIMFLQQRGISLNMAFKIFKAYGKDTQQTVTSNPYRLIEDIDGIGFLTADRIAKTVGIESTSEFRLRAGLICALRESGERGGNTFLYRDELMESAAALLGLEGQYVLLERVIDSLLIQNVLKSIELSAEDSDVTSSANAIQSDCDSATNPNENSDESRLAEKSGQALFLRPAYHAESGCAVRLVNLRHNFTPPDDQADVLADIEEYKSIYGIDLNDEQREAVTTAFENGISVITGSPGTGKTTIIKCLLYLFEKRKQTFMLMAPTGRAAKRINESTGQEASTIHRALKLPNYAEDMPQLQCDNVIVDEVSMMDIYLFSALLKSLRDGTRLILLGDKDQLPSVGAGNILSDILQRLPKVMLQKIYRQAEKSLIIKNAHMINSGQMPRLDVRDADFFFIQKDNAEDIAQTVVELLSTRLPQYLNVDSGKIQVLCPLKNGLAGTKNLNDMLSAALNKNGGDKVAAGGCEFKRGDKVMQTSNNYNQEWKRGSESGEGVFNGDMGVTESVSASPRQVVVLFEDGRRAVYTDNIDELTLSYAITVHKSQGSEFEAVVMPVLAGSPVVLTRNLLYTAVTRAKRLVALVGEKYWIKRMVDNNYIAKRNSALTHFIDEAEQNYAKLFGIGLKP